MVPGTSWEDALSSDPWAKVHGHGYGAEGRPMGGSGLLVLSFLISPFLVHATDNSG